MGFFHDRNEKFIEFKNKACQLGGVAMTACNQALPPVSDDESFSIANINSAIDKLKSAIEAFSEASSYFNKCMWSRAEDEVEGALLVSMESPHFTVAAKAERELDELYSKTDKKELYKLGIRLYNQLGIMSLYLRDMKSISQQGAFSNITQESFIIELIQADMAFTRAIKLLDDLHMPRLGRFREREWIEEPIQHIAKQDLLHIINQLNSEDKMIAFDLILNQPDSIIGQRFWKQEGAFPCKRNAGTLAIVDAAYEALIQETEAEQKANRFGMNM